MMEQDRYIYYLENLLEQDPDYVVDVLDITTEELVALFHKRVKAFIESEYGDLDE